MSGRHTRLTPAVQQTIVNALAVGVPFASACQLAGIGHDTGLEWLERGEGRHPKRPSTPAYVQFAHAISHARAQDEARRVARIHKAGEGGTLLERTTTTHPDGRVITKERYMEPDWRADAFHLERSRPQEWGQRLRVDVQRTIQRIAAKLASEATAAGTPITAEEVLAEAQRLLDEADREAQEGHDHA